MFDRHMNDFSLQTVTMIAKCIEMTEKVFTGLDVLSMTRYVKGGPSDLSTKILLKF